MASSEAEGWLMGSWVLPEPAIRHRGAEGPALATRREPLPTQSARQISEDGIRRFWDEQDEVDGVVERLLRP